MKEEIILDLQDRLNAALSALSCMYGQYCAKEGHLFMSAGEQASTVLEDEFGFIFDEIGRGDNNYFNIQ